MSAKLFYLPFSTATVNGIAQPGAQLFFYQTGTLTKLPIYTTNLLDVQLTNPVVATGAGRFPDIYLDSTQTYRLIVKDQLGATLDDIDPLIPGTVEGLVVGNSSPTANNRGELAAMIGGTGSNAMAFLSEPGREGMFVWTTGDQSAKVTADPNQGVYVPPAADTTGAAGAWVRKFTGPLNVKWFGATGVGSGTNDAAAIQAAINVSSALKNPVNTGYGAGSGPPVYVPTATSSFYCGGTKLTINHTMRIYGDDNGMPTGTGSALAWDGTTTGIQIGTTAAGTTVEGLSFNGGFTTTEGEFHAIKRLCTSAVRNCFFIAWPGDAVNDDENVGGGTTNGSIIEHIFAQDCRNAHKALGSDANAGTNIGIVTKICRQAGVYQGGFLGDHYYSCSQNGAAATSWNTGAAGHPASYCHAGGQHYAVMVGQETWCQTNAPYSATVTITIASPGVVTWTAHGLTDGAKVAFSTTGALPTGLTAATTYYVVNSAANTFQVAATLGGAAINTSGTQSGVHTSGAAKSNTGWIYWTVGAAAPSTGIPTWFTGMSCRAGGAYIHTDANNESTFVGCYAEDNCAAQFDRSAVLVSPFITAKWAVSGGVLYGEADGDTGNKFRKIMPASSESVPVQLGRTQIQSTSGTSTAVLWNSSAIAAGVFTNLVFTQGLEADGVTPLSVARIGAYHTSTNPAAAEGIIYFGTRTYAGTGAYTDWIQLDGSNQMWTPLTTNQMSLGSTTLRWKNLWLSGNSAVAGSITSTGATSGVGYASGAGGAVTQATSKATGVTLNTVCGAITMQAAALAAAAKVSFVVTDSAVAATDTVIVSVASGGTANAYRAAVTAVAAGSFTVTVENITAGSLSEAPVINFSVVKSVAA
jgi:hypothetical protein